MSKNFSCTTTSLTTSLRYLTATTSVKNFFIHFSLHFTFEKELNSSLPFLDFLVDKHSTGFIIFVYRKPTFCRPVSILEFIPTKRKINLKPALVHRVMLICSRSRLLSELDEIRSILVANGYPNHIIASTITKKIRQFNH